MPLAVQWGGQVLSQSNGSSRQQPFALATNLSTVCRELDMDFIQDCNVGQFEYWGAVGHYTIASVACDIVQDPQLKKLIQANAHSIAFPASEITIKNMKGLSKRPFVPLADVPDMVWKVGPFKRGGMSSRNTAIILPTWISPTAMARRCSRSARSQNPTSIPPCG